MGDAAQRDHRSRYNNDGLVVPPGRSTTDLGLTGLRKSDARNFSQRLPVDLATIRLVDVWVAPVGKPLTLALLCQSIRATSRNPTGKSGISCPPAT